MANVVNAGDKFTPRKVTSARNGVNSAYNDLITTLTTNMTTKFVDVMANKWACKEAKDYFTNYFKKGMDDLVEEVNRIFQSVVVALNDAGKIWSVGTGDSGTFTIETFKKSTKKVEITSIKEKFSDGSIGITGDAKSTASTKLKEIATTANGYLDQAVKAVKDVGLYDLQNNQQESIGSSLTTIKNNVNKAIEEAKRQIEKSIEDTAKRYSEIAKKVAQSFGGK